jgi:hypothetical protein
MFQLASGIWMKKSLGFMEQAYGDGVHLRDGS